MPHCAYRFLNTVGLDIALQPIRSAAQCQFTQRDQVTFAEKIARGAFGLRQFVDFAELEPVQQFIGRQIHQHYFVGGIEHGIRQGFRNPDAGNAAHHIVQAFQMLDIQCGEDIDPGIQ